MREPQPVAQAFPNRSSHQLLNVTSKQMSRVFPIDNFIFHHSHMNKCLSGQVACSDHNSKSQSFEEMPEAFNVLQEEQMKQRM